MTEPSRPRPVPGPPRPGPAAAPVAGTAAPAGPGALVGPAPVDGTGAAVGNPLAGLDQRPVAEHVAVFEAEHDRLRRELATIDQL
ncbi:MULTISPECIES: hypothetical protein [unclassified Geodermatophilus]